MVEKMGHKKQMQSMRMEWINEGKPRASTQDDSIFDEPNLPARSDEREKTASRVAPIFEKTATERPKTPVVDEDAEMDDLYDATPRAPRQKSIEGGTQALLPGASASIFGPAKNVATVDEPPEDDLDALLAEEEMLQAEAAKSKPNSTADKPAVDASFDDEMEAMAEMDDMW